MHIQCILRNEVDDNTYSGDISSLAVQNSRVGELEPPLVSTTMRRNQRCYSYTTYRVVTPTPCLFRLFFDYFAKKQRFDVETQFDIMSYRLVLCVPLSIVITKDEIPYTFSVEKVLVKPIDAASYYYEDVLFGMADSPNRLDNDNDNLNTYLEFEDRDITQGQQICHR